MIGVLRTNHATKNFEVAASIDSVELALAEVLNCQVSVFYLVLATTQLVPTDVAAELLHWSMKIVELANAWRSLQRQMMTMSSAMPFAARFLVPAEEP